MDETDSPQTPPELLIILERHDLCGLMLDAVNLHLEAKGIREPVNTFDLVAFVIGVTVGAEPCLEALFRFIAAPLYWKIQLSLSVTVPRGLLRQVESFHSDVLQ